MAIFFIKETPKPYNKIGDGPEGPEVRVVTEWLHYNYANSTIKNIISNEKSSLMKNGTYKNIENVLHLHIEGVTCKDKHILWLCIARSGDKI